jgi:putative copper resistance protein D
VPVVAAAVSALVVLGFALWWGGGVTGRPIVVLPDAGPLTAWGLPVVRLLVDGGATLTAGFCVVAAFLLPGSPARGDGQLLGPAAYRMLRAATWWAAGWALGCLAMLWFTLSDLLGQPLSQVSLGGVWSLALSVNNGQALLVQAVLAAAVAVGSRLVLSRSGAAAVALLACVACLPPALTGHAAGPATISSR